MASRGAELVACGFVAVIVYWNSLQGGFVFDDHRGILKNDDIRTDATPLSNLWVNDFWGGAMSREVSHKSYRPITVLSYRYLNYAVAGLEPYTYHLVNVCLHAAVTVLFVYALQTVFPKRKQMALVTGLLFAVHSVHSEAVANVVGRAELLSGFFFLLSFICYVKCCDYDGGIKCWLWLANTLVQGICSMLSKEQGITCLGVCAAYDLFLHYDVLVTWFKNRGNKAKQSASFPVGTITRISVLTTSLVVLLNFRLAMNAGAKPIFKSDELRASFHENRLTRILSFSYIYSFNAWLLLCPYGLCCDWSLGSLPLIHNFTDAYNLASLFLYLTIAVFAVYVLLCPKRSDRVAVGLGLAFLVLPFVPAMGIVFQVGFVVAERVLYMPSMGFCMLIAIGYNRIRKRYGKIAQIGLGFTLLLMTAKTMSRNWDWQTDINLYKSGVKINPTNVKMYSNYGLELKNRGEVATAKDLYQRALLLEPDYTEATFNLGNVLSDEGNLEEAARLFEKSLASSYTKPQALNNLAATLMKLGRIKEAEKRFEEVIQIKPDHAQAYNNLASLYGETKRYKEAEEVFRKALAVLPSYTEAYFNLGTLLYQMGRSDEAETNLRQALSLNPNHKGAQNNLEVVLYNRKRGKG
ncbi:protein O-mannosyl-transferase TMTC3-like [Oscarella lobularis]|uniref:protein O-mannosyl-transferase TMTC3-like n=1 Tax=Oscarella lobularis TaxID=121494 RepID=UPI003313207A